jgi:hypothetical protein
MLSRTPICLELTLGGFVPYVDATVILRAQYRRLHGLYRGNGPVDESLDCSWLRRMTAKDRGAVGWAGLGWVWPIRTLSYLQIKLK